MKRALSSGEAILGRLCGRTFLGPWSISSPFRKARKSPRANGKELCDLIVVFGRDVLIFSEKTIGFSSAEIGVAWPRWHERAIVQSCKQALGAERILTARSCELFSDPQCHHPLHLEIPETPRFHRIVVAQGAADRSMRYFGDGNGSLLTVSSRHPTIETAPFEANAFALGPDHFFHVFDEVTIHAVLNHIDTAPDFINYLEKRETLLRAYKLFMCRGEEGLLAHYVTRVDPDGTHGFSELLATAPPAKADFVHYDEDDFASIALSPEYIAKRQADQVSYGWDRLIEYLWQERNFSIYPERGYSDAEAERALREMAAVSRLERRHLASAFIDAGRTSRGKQSYVRAIVQDGNSARAHVCYVFLFTNTDKLMPAGSTYDQFRQVRISILRAYALRLREKFPDARWVIGLTTEAPAEEGGRNPIIDAMVADISALTPQEIAADRDLLDLVQPLRDDRVERVAFKEREYPERVTPA